MHPTAHCSVALVPAKNYHSGVLQTRFPDRENALVIFSDAFLSEFPMDITETK